MRRPPPAGRAASSRRLAALAAAFESTRNLAASLEQCPEEQPASGSPAEREFARQHEFAAGRGQQPLAEVDRHGRVLVVLAAQHVWALGGLLEPRWPPAPGRTLARVAVQSAGGAWWLYDPRLDVRERLARGRALAHLGVAGLLAQAHAPALEERPPHAAELAAMMLDAAPAGAAETWKARAREVVAGLFVPENPAGAREEDVEDAPTLAAAALVLYTESAGRRLRYHGRGGTQWAQWRDHVGRLVTRYSR